jgi:hypothetical protein
VKIPRYDALETISRRHAELDKITARIWLEEAEIYSRLKVVDHRLLKLRRAWPDVKKEKPSEDPD